MDEHGTEPTPPKSLRFELPERLTLGIRARRWVALFLFLAVVIVFRHLAAIGVTFVAASSGLGFIASWLARKTTIRRKLAAGIVFGLFIVLLGGLIALGVSRSVAAYAGLAHGGLEDWIATIRQSEPVQRIEALDIDVKPAIQAAERFGSKALGTLRLSGELLLHALIGLLIALIYRLEQEEVDADLTKIDRSSMFGNMLIYASYLGEAVLAALKLQVAVAAVNSVLTGIVILVMGLPGAPTLIALVFFFGLIPVAGNVLSGALLAILAYAHNGVVGVVVFIVSTFVLHKLESFYLNPRLSRKHVHLPPLAIILSLIAFEHLFGILGLFLSFPAIYFTIRIAQYLRSEPFPEVPA